MNIFRPSKPRGLVDPADLAEPERRRPLIGVSGPSHGGWIAWFALRFAVWLAGGRARRITPDHPLTHAAPRIDGLILTGGADIEPRRYGAVATRPMAIDPPRDTLELALAADAYQRRLPTLGICRGMQIMVVAGGGTLIEHIEPRARAHFSPLPRWRATVQPGSRLAMVLGRETAPINKIHHQAVDTPGAQLHISAWDGDGLVQGIEAPTRPLYVGVQWHPEYMQYLSPHRRLIRTLVRAARGLPAVMGHRGALSGAGR